ncbi:hypothetical protein RGQ29_025868 [Quercus rubra]|uniref:Uncharacterized protein n=1 Tax=Quercus rubra TaxID=3512 RepID=A0AAN7IR57_QUERU|nr:hypothetical protein RGQ29_025868 [Quercus rubra]
MYWFALRDWWRSHATWRTAYLLFLGQVVSFVMALMSFTSSLIADLDGSKPLLGDVLVIAGTVFYAMSNVGEEFCVKKKNRIEVAAMIGVYGFLVSAVEISIVEIKSLESIEWSTDLILAFAGYAVSTFMFYTIAPFVLQLSGATMFNLSTLTSDMWVVLIRIFFYH